MRRWFAADVTVLAGASEAVESALGVVGSIGTSTDSLRKDPDHPLVVTGYFDEPVSVEDVEYAIVEELQHTGHGRDSVLAIEFRTVENEDWLAEWKRHWQPTEIGKFVIAPPWFELDQTDKIVVRIDPNRAFGTGTHETTQLCLKAISEIYDPSMSLLDVGTGTGILAIAAAKRGGENILACDVDHDSVHIARANAAANGVGERVKFFEGRVRPETEAHEFVCANLTLDVILPILELLSDKATRYLLLSGILAEQKKELIGALAALGLSEASIETSGEWISVLVKK